MEHRCQRCYARMRDRSESFKPRIGVLEKKTNTQILAVDNNTINYDQCTRLTLTIKGLKCNSSKTLINTWARYLRHPRSMKWCDEGRWATSLVETMAHGHPDRVQCSYPTFVIGRHRWTRDVRMLCADGWPSSPVTDCRRIARPDHRTSRNR